jgi:hypothetical protein
VDTGKLTARLFLCVCVCVCYFTLLSWALPVLFVLCSDRYLVNPFVPVAFFTFKVLFFACFFIFIYSCGLQFVRTSKFLKSVLHPKS